MRKRISPTLSLREEPFFRDTNEAVLARIEPYVYSRDYEPRQIIYFPDDPCDYAYWVREGRVRITRVSRENRELTFCHLVSGDVFGEECLGDVARRNNYAEAMDATTLFLMRSDDFRRIAGEEAEFARSIARSTGRRLAQMEQLLCEMAFQSVRSRVAAGILRLYHRDAGGEEAILRVTHQELANLVGSTRETTTAVLHELREHGVIKIANRRLTVVNPIGLQNLAQE